jgi:hypothetical protein
MKKDADIVNSLHKIACKITESFKISIQAILIKQKKFYANTLEVMLQTALTRR